MKPGDREETYTSDGVSYSCSVHRDVPREHDATACVHEQVRARYPSVGFDEEAWKVLLTVRQDVFERLLDDLGKLSP